jgi:hypothetical protein
MCRVTRALRPTDRLARALLVPALAFVATSVDRNYQTDLWHHLARGRALVEEGTLLDADRFTFTVPGIPLRDVNWGWQAAFYLLYRAGGLPLVQTANSAVLVVTMGLLVASPAGAVARRPSLAGSASSPSSDCGRCSSSGRRLSRCSCSSTSWECSKPPRAALVGFWSRLC